MEEYVNRVLIFIWFNPPKAPVRADREITMIKRLTFKLLINNNGAIFCHLNIIKHWGHSSSLITCGNHTCIGAIPAFIVRARIIKASLISRVTDLIWENLIIVERINIREAIAWTIKYLIAASVRGFFNLNRIRGIILIKLISSPTQLVNQELEEIATVVPSIRVNIKI